MKQEYDNSSDDENFFTKNTKQEDEFFDVGINEEYGSDKEIKEVLERSLQTFQEEEKKRESIYEQTLETSRIEYINILSKQINTILNQAKEKNDPFYLIVIESCENLLEKLPKKSCSEKEFEFFCEKIKILEKDIKNFEKNINEIFFEEEKKVNSLENEAKKTLEIIQKLFTENGIFGKIESYKSFIDQKNFNFLEKFKNICNEYKNFLSKFFEKDNKKNENKDKQDIFYIFSYSESLNTLIRNFNQYFETATKIFDSAIEKQQNELLLQIFTAYLKTDDVVSFKQIFQEYAGAKININNVIDCAIEKNAINILSFLQNEKEIPKEIIKKIDNFLKVEKEMEKYQGAGRFSSIFWHRTFFDINETLVGEFSDNPLLDDNKKENEESNISSNSEDEIKRKSSDEEEHKNCILC